MARSVERLVTTLSQEDTDRLVDGLAVLNQLFEGAVQPPMPPEEDQDLIRDIQKS
jgi:hypothetical protein